MSHPSLRVVKAAAGTEYLICTHSFGHRYELLDEFKRMFVNSVSTLTQRIIIIGNCSASLLNIPATDFCTIPRTKYLFELEARIHNINVILSRCIFVPFYGNRD